MAGQAALQLVQPAAIFAGALLASLAVRQVLIGRLRRLAARADGYVLIFAGVLRLPSLLWSVAAALAISLRFADLTGRQIRAVETWIVIFLIVSLSLAAAAAAVRSVTFYGQRKRIPFAVAGLSRTLTYVLVLGTGGLVLVNYLGLSITPVLTALGVGGLAVALALQDTLANLFAGVHILVEEPISLGHWIRLSTGEEGQVADIGWRTTRLLTGAGSIVVVPNTKITSGILTNFSLPENKVTVEVAVLVGLEADPALVRDIVLEEVRTGELLPPGAVPVLLFDPGVLPTHMHFRLFVPAARQIESGGVRSEINLKLAARFRREGIPLPSPPIPATARS